MSGSLAAYHIASHERNLATELSWCYKIQVIRLFSMDGWLVVVGLTAL